MEVTGTNEVVETNEVGVVSTNEVPVTETNDWVHFVTNVVCTDAETNYEYLVSDVTLVTVRTNGVEPSAQYTLTFNDQSGAFTSPNPPFYSEDILVTGTNIVYQTNLVEVVSTNEELLSVTNEFVSIITNAICTTNDSTIETNYEYLLAPAEFVNLETNEIVITNCAGIEIKYEYIAIVTTGIPEEVTNLVVINETNLVSVEQTNLVTEDVTNLVASLVTNQVAGLSTNTTASLFGAVAGSVSGSVGKQKINLSVRALGYGIPTAGIGQSSASATLTLSGKVEQELVVLGGSCKLAVKGQPSQSSTLSDLEWEPAYLSNTLMITSSLLPTKISGTDAKGNMHCAGQAVISTAADHGLYGNTVQVWEQSKNSLQEVGNFSGTGAERGASLHWKATRQLDQTQGNAVVSGRLLGQSFSQPVFFDWP